MTTRASDVYRTPLAETLPETLTISLGDQVIRCRKAVWPTPEGTVGLRYGENPHQPAACYVPEGARGPLAGLRWVKSGKGGPSWINVADLDHAWRFLRYLEAPAAAVMKHLNPAGVAVARPGEALADVWRAARDCDARAAFGGVAVFNREVDGPAAHALLETFIEVVAAPSYTEEALAALGKKSDLRIAVLPDTGALSRFEGDAAGVEIKVLGDGTLLVQRPYVTRIRGAADFTCRPVAGEARCERAPSEAEAADLLLAWWVATAVRSNAVVLVRDGRTLAVGTGEQERVGAVEQAIAKAAQKGHDLRGAAVASDAFFPFPDAIEALAAAGVRAVVQPGGSLRDAAVIAACNAHQIAMVFTHERCFSH
jgi:phosphoribosylaminoimidazolecarboxamide formyltransferase/IMP cyclohydrolase